MHSAAVIVVPVGLTPAALAKATVVQAALAQGAVTHLTGTVLAAQQDKKPEPNAGNAPSSKGPNEVQLLLGQMSESQRKPAASETDPVQEAPRAQMA